MKNLMKTVLVGGLALLFVGMMPVKVKAAGLPFSVAPQTPSTQRIKSEGYFDVVVGAGKSTPLQVNLQNHAAHAIKVNVAINVAQTNDNGQVDYTLPQKKDATLTTDFSSLVKGKKQIQIPAKSTYHYVARLTMPTHALTGVVAGGLVFTPATTHQNTGSGLTIHNRYTYSIAVVARQQNKTWAPKLTIAPVTVQQQAARVTLAVPLHNVASTYLNQLRVESQATNLTTGKVVKRTVSDRQMAPNSHFYYQLALPKKVVAGKYQVTTHAYYVKDQQGTYAASDGQHYRYQQQRTSQVKISQKQADRMNQRTKERQGGTPWFVYAVIIGFVVLVLIIAGLIFLLVHRKRSERE